MEKDCFLSSVDVDKYLSALQNVEDEVISEEVHIEELEIDPVIEAVEIEEYARKVLLAESEEKLLALEDEVDFDNISTEVFNDYIKSISRGAVEHLDKDDNEKMEIFGLKSSVSQPNRTAFVGKFRKDVNAMHKYKSLLTQQRLAIIHERNSIKANLIKNDTYKILFMPVDVDILKELISRETSKMRSKVDSVYLRIVRLVEKELYKYYPLFTKVVFEKMPEMFLPNAGFKYINEYSSVPQELDIYPNMPVFPKPGMEYDLLKNAEPKAAAYLERQVSYYFALLDRLVKSEIRVAQKVSSCNLIIKLLDLHPSYYKLYMEIYYERNETV